MTLNPFPPQAYTKDTLAKAYLWLKNQPEHIQKLAGNADLLIGLYLKAQRQGIESLETPSIQNFRAELKNLAGMMGEFEVVEPEQKIEKRDHHEEALSPHLSSSATSSVSVLNKGAPNTAIQPNYSAPTGQPNAAATKTESKNFLDSKINIDIKSRQMIREVKEMLNLSHDEEALRALISIGHKKLHSILQD